MAVLALVFSGSTSSLFSGGADGQTTDDEKSLATTGDASSRNLKTSPRRLCSALLQGCVVVAGAQVMDGRQIIIIGSWEGWRAA